MPHELAGDGPAVRGDSTAARRGPQSSLLGPVLGGLVSLAAGLAIGCGTSSQPSTPIDAATATAPSRDPFREAGLGFERIALRRLRLSLEVPDPKGWRPVRGPSRFVRLEHSATTSSLVVRVWLEVNRMTPKSCEESARLFRELPKGGELLAREPRLVAGFDSEVRVGVRPIGVAPATSVEGYVTAFGARGRACLAFAFVTRAEGSDARRIVEDRLALFDERTLAGLRPEGFDEDALRESTPR
ncbi:MAG: hypothetical protein FJ095_12935 [Deltaproteobacteria bacterium]|nr:hypothetical protein [Deltaproteobacteria bacterium]